LKKLDERMRVVAAIKTVDLFGKENVTMPGFVIKDGAKYKPEGLQAIQDFHDEVPCYAFDCIIFDLRPEFIDFCAANNVGLLTSTSKDAIKADKIKEQLALMVEAQDRVPMVCFRADNAAETNAILQEIIAEKNEMMRKRYFKPTPANDTQSSVQQIAANSRPNRRGGMQPN
jgi:hypothetical protein